MSMTPPAHTVARARCYVSGVIRLIAFVGVCLVAIPMAERVESIWYDVFNFGGSPFADPPDYSFEDFVAAISRSVSIFLSPEVLARIMPITIGVLWPRRLARWIVPVPRNEDTFRMGHLMLSAAIRLAALLVVAVLAEPVAGSAKTQWGNTMLQRTGSYTWWSWEYLPAALGAAGKVIFTAGRIVTMLAIMVAVLFPHRLARWILPVPDLSRCPRCQYKAGDAATCPECGLRLNDQSPQPPKESLA